MTNLLKVGDIAPDFELTSTTKGKLSLSDYRGEKNAIVAFFPMDFTPGWIKEITSWKEDYKKITNLDAEVLAISVDHIYSHNVFSASLGMLPYPLLSDWHKQTVQTYGVFNEHKEIAVRSVFLVDKAGTIQFINTVFDANNQAHYQQVFDELKKIKETPN